MKPIDVVGNTLALLIVLSIGGGILALMGAAVYLILASETAKYVHIPAAMIVSGLFAIPIAAPLILAANRRTQRQAQETAQAEINAAQQAAIDKRNAAAAARTNPFGNINGPPPKPKTAAPHTHGNQPPRSDEE